MRKKFFLALAIVWMIVIFAFSSRPRELSAEDSCAVGMMVGTVLVDNFSQLSAEEQMNYAKQIDHPVRKTAHAMEYALLAVLLVGVFYDRNSTKIISYVVPWIIASVYAATDEFHQLFVSGRGAQLKDVLLDSCGALAGMLILWAFMSIIHRVSQRQLFSNH